MSKVNFLHLNFGNFLTTIVPGLSYIRSCLVQSQETRFANFMSIDWLPIDVTRRFSDHVYTEPRLIRTIKGTLQDRQVPMHRLYDIFTIYKENSRVLAEGNLFVGESCNSGILTVNSTYPDLHLIKKCEPQPSSFKFTLTLCV